MTEEPDTFQANQSRHYTASQLRQHAVIDNFVNGILPLDEAINVLSAMGYPPDDKQLADMEAFDSKYLSQID